MGRIAMSAIFGSPPLIFATARVRPFVVVLFLLVFLFLVLIRSSLVVVGSGGLAAAWLRLSGLGLPVTASLCERPGCQEERGGEESGESQSRCAAVHGGTPPRKKGVVAKRWTRATPQ
jgi:hypothetical protein